MNNEQIAINAEVAAPLEKVWQCWTQPEHITQWNFASDDWCCPRAENDLQVGGRYQARMEAKDGSFGFGFEAVYDEISPHKTLIYTMGDGRKVTTNFASQGTSTQVTTTFDAEQENSIDMQRDGWQAILNNFKAYVESQENKRGQDNISDELTAPKVVDRNTFQAKVDALRIREKAHMKEGDAIAASRRRLPMVEVNAGTPLIDERGTVTLLEAFEGRSMLIAYYFMWHHGRTTAKQCHGCAWFTSQVRELSTLHSRDVTYATFCQGPYEKTARYRDFMGWEMPWYSVQGASLETLLDGRQAGMMYLICYLRQGDRVFETYWTTRRGVEVMGNSYPLLDLTVYGRQEWWEDSPTAWPQPWNDEVENAHPFRSKGRPIVQWPRVNAGYSDNLGSGSAE